MKITDMIILSLTITIPMICFFNNVDNKLSILETKLSEIENKIDSSGKQKKTSQSYTITAYTPHKSETNNDPQKTATMEKPIPGGTCAVSRDLIHWLGGRIYVEGFGVWRVNDLMNKRFENSIDFCVGTKEQAKIFGKSTYNVIFLGR